MADGLLPVIIFVVCFRPKAMILPPVSSGLREKKPLTISVVIVLECYILLKCCIFDVPLGLMGRDHLSMPLNMSPNLSEDV